MPQYGQHSVSVFPQHFVYLFGQPAMPTGPAALQSVQFETISEGEKSIPVSPSLTLGMHGYTERQVTWVTSFYTNPSDISLILQGSIDDVDADYTTVDTSTNTSGESRTANSNFQFFRVLVYSLVGAATATVKIALM